MHWFGQEARRQEILAGEGVFHERQLPMPNKLFVTMCGVKLEALLFAIRIGFLSAVHRAMPESAPRSAKGRGAGPTFLRFLQSPTATVYDNASVVAQALYPPYRAIWYSYTISLFVVQVRYNPPYVPLSHCMQSKQGGHRRSSCC